MDIIDMKDTFFIAGAKIALFFVKGNNQPAKYFAIGLSSMSGRQFSEINVILAG